MFEPSECSGKAPLASSKPWTIQSDTLVCRRLSYREAARTHTIPETTIDTMEQFINRAVTEPSRREKELMRLIGNSIPVMTLNSVVSHLLSLLNW